MGGYLSLIFIFSICLGDTLILKNDKVYRGNFWMDMAIKAENLSVLSKVRFMSVFCANENLITGSNDKQ